MQQKLTLFCLIVFLSIFLGSVIYFVTDVEKDEVRCALGSLAFRE